MTGVQTCALPILRASAAVWEARWQAWGLRNIIRDTCVQELRDVGVVHQRQRLALGFKAADVKRADVLLIGHGHVDHMSDAASVGARTGAIVVGAPVTTEKLATQAINMKQVRTVTGRGGELLKFKGFTVEPILGRHGEPPHDVVDAFDQALKKTKIGRAHV